jgi:hypothetical protein
MGFVRRLDNRVILILFYFLSFWPLLVNNGVYWDDWVLYDQTSQTLARMFSELGSPPAGYLVRALVSAPPVIGKWFVFAVYLAAMLVGYQVLVKSRLFGKNAAFLLALFAALIPFNSARITMACASYALCCLLFLLGSYALVAYMADKKTALRLASLALFFVSFTTNSLLVFYLVPLLYVVYCERASLRSLRETTRTALSYLDFILLPVVFYALKAAFVVPYGIYEGYNKITVANLARSPLEFLRSLRASFVQVVWGSLDVSTLGALVVGVALIAVTYWAIVRRAPERAEGRDAHRLPAQWFVFGILLFFLGILPYLAIGREGATFGSEWESRDQLLLGIGAAFMLVYGVTYLFGRLHIGVRIQQLVFAVLVASFVLANVTVYLQFQADWFKQAALIEHVKGTPEIRDHTTFAVDDRARALDAIGRHVQFYEYNGMLKRAFGTTTRLAAPSSDIPAFANPPFLAMCVERAQYNFRDYVYTTPTHTIVVEPGSRRLGLSSMGRLLVEEFLDPAAFRRDVKQVLTVNTEPLPPPPGPAE